VNESYKNRSSYEKKFSFIISELQLFSALPIMLFILEFRVFRDLNFVLAAVRT
jgi:hypothetical protein